MKFRNIDEAWDWFNGRALYHRTFMDMAKEVALPYHICRRLYYARLGPGDRRTFEETIKPFLKHISSRRIVA